MGLHVSEHSCRSGPSTALAQLRFSNIITGRLLTLSSTSWFQMVLTPRDTDCPGFDGNSDFYGLGIRIGIYLQWSSAWISNSINPSGAAANHDANTAFLIALLVAFAVALGNGSLRLVEAYVMILLSGGFFFTAVSFLGLRLYFLQPWTTRIFRESMVAVHRTFVAQV